MHLPLPTGKQSWPYPERELSLLYAHEAKGRGFYRGNFLKGRERDQETETNTNACSQTQSPEQMRSEKDAL